MSESENTPNKRRRIFTKDNALYGLTGLVIAGGIGFSIYGIQQDIKQEDEKLNRLWNQAATRADINYTGKLDPSEFSYLVDTIREGHRLTDVQRKAEGKGPLLGDSDRRHIKIDNPHTGEKEIRIAIEGLEYFLKVAPEREPNYNSGNFWQNQ